MKSDEESGRAIIYGILEIGLNNGTFGTKGVILGTLECMAGWIGKQIDHSIQMQDLDQRECDELEAVNAAILHLKKTKAMDDLVDVRVPLTENLIIDAADGNLARMDAEAHNTEIPRDDDIMLGETPDTDELPPPMGTPHSPDCGPQT